MMDRFDALNILINTQEDIIRQLKEKYINNKDNKSLHDIRKLERKVRDLKEMLPAKYNKKSSIINPNFPKIRFNGAYFTLEQPIDKESSYIIWADYDKVAPEDEDLCSECGIKYKLGNNIPLDLVYSNNSWNINDRKKDHLNLYMYEDPDYEGYTYKSFICKESVREVFKEDNDEDMNTESIEDSKNNNGAADNSDNEKDDIYYIQL